MSWTIKPYESVGPLLIGQAREDVRNQIGANYDSFSKDSGENLTDAYDEIGMHLYYTGKNTLEFIEFFDPAQIDFQGKALLGRPFPEIQKEFSELGYVGRPSDVGYEYDDLGIALTLEGGQVEGVGVYRRGYLKIT